MKHIKILLITALFILASCWQNSDETKTKIEENNSTWTVKNQEENLESQQVIKVLEPTITKTWAVISSDDGKFIVRIPAEAFEDLSKLSVQEIIDISREWSHPTYKLVSSWEKKLIIPFQIIMNYNYESEVKEIFEKFNKEEWTNYTEDNITILRNGIDAPIFRDQSLDKLSYFGIEFDWEYQFWLSDAPTVLSDYISKLDISGIYTIFPIDYDVSSIFKTTERYNPSKFEAWETMNIIQWYLNKNNRKDILDSYDKYKIQLFWWINEKWEKIIFANYFCSEFEDWRTRLIEVEDWWSCFFNLKVNLDTQEVYDFYVNWNA